MFLYFFSMVCLCSPVVVIRVPEVLCHQPKVSKTLNLAAPSSGGPEVVLSLSLRLSIPLSLSPSPPGAFGPQENTRVCVCVCSQPSIMSVSINRRRGVFIVSAHASLQEHQLLVSGYSLQNSAD